MDPINEIKNPVSVITPEPRNFACPTNLKTDEDSARIQEDGVSNKIETAKISENSDRKNAKMPAGKLSLKGKRISEVSDKIKAPKGLVGSHGKNNKPPAKDGKLPLKRAKSDRLPVPQMVMEAIKALKKRNGASVEAILEYMENQHRVEAKLVKRYVSRYVKSAVQKGIIEQLAGAGDDGRYKIKKAEKVAKAEPKLRVNKEKAKAVKD